MVREDYIRLLESSHSTDYNLSFFISKIQSLTLAQHVNEIRNLDNGLVRWRLIIL